MEGTQPHRTTNREEMQTYRTPELQNSVEQAQPSFFKKTLLKYFALLSTITRKNIMLRRNHPGSSSSGHIISWTYPHKEFPPSLRGWSGELPPSPSYRPGPKMQTQKKMRQPKGRSRGRGKKTERKSVFILKKGKNKLCERQSGLPRGSAPNAPTHCQTSQFHVKVRRPPPCRLY